MHSELARPQTTGLVEVLDRVLDKGLFFGGEINISLDEVDLMTLLEQQLLHANGKRPGRVTRTRRVLARAVK